ncbi:TetR/AcrR family transcriptional regulator [Streptomyces sp. BE230]|uniref:TetR/AcrR family transcriptional regulator n=1 Tax=Streptomyces sp. BE230 TaxID=3002526 RepID=UPI002ED5CDDB|nr:TetR family transcriptional regulator [Streptomyces sp. BE230]
MTTTGPTPRRSRGRPAGSRSGETETRVRILEAARELFASRTYGATTIRAVAAAADVNPALVHHFFGTKRDLFAATVQLPEPLVGQLPGLVAGDMEDIGRYIVRLYLTMWQDPSTARPLAAMVRTGMSDPEAADILKQVLTSTILGPLAAASGRDQPGLRITLAATHLVGLAMGRHILTLQPLTEADVDHLAACVGPAIQHYLTGPLPPPPSAAAGGTAC